jgi:hypothetical protein
VFGIPAFPPRIRIVGTNPDPFNVFRYRTKKLFSQKKFKKFLNKNSFMQSEKGDGW